MFEFGGVNHVGCLYFILLAFLFLVYVILISDFLVLVVVMFVNLETIFIFMDVFGFSFNGFISKQLK